MASDKSTSSTSSRESGSGRMGRMFDTLRVSNYRNLWLGTVASWMGSQMQMVAQSLLVYDLTHSPLKLGIVSALSILPMFFLALYTGVIIDRFPKRHIILISQIGSGAVTLTVAILVALGAIQYWHLVITATLGGIFGAFNMPARNATIPEIVPRDKLFNAMALNSVGGNAASVVGPALAGWLLTIIGTSGVYFCAAGICAVACISFGMLPIIRLKTEKTVHSLNKEMAEVILFLRKNTTILTILILELIITIFAMPYSTLMPVFAEILKVNSSGYGFLMASSGVGAIIGSLVVATLGHYREKGRLLLGVGIIFGMVMVIFSQAHEIGRFLGVETNIFYLSMFLLMLVGAASATYTTTSNTIIQMNISDNVRGRLTSAYFIVVGLFPVGILAMSATAEALGAPIAVAIGGVILTLIMLIMNFTFRRIRNME
jgi:MFS family permease